MTKYAGVALSALLAATSAAGAGGGQDPMFGKGIWLQRACSAFLRPSDEGAYTPEDATMAAACEGFVAGVEQVLLVQRAICRPRLATVGQSVQVVANHLAEHPSELQMPAGQLTMDALLKGFPCAGTR